MGDKSPKSKERDQKKRNAATTKNTEAARAKQAGQSQYQRPSTKGKG
jgi:hypothetical protein